MAVRGLRDFLDASCVPPGVRRWRIDAGSAVDAAGAVVPAGGARTVSLVRNARRALTACAAHGAVVDDMVNPARAGARALIK